MKLLTFVFAVICIAYLANGAVIDLTPRDNSEAYKDHQSLGINGIATGTVDLWTGTGGGCTEAFCKDLCKDLGFDHSKCIDDHTCECTR